MSVRNAIIFLAVTLSAVLSPALLFADPVLDVHWTNNEKKSVTIRVSGDSEVAERCLQNGLEVRYRFEFEVCRRRTLWFSACKDTRILSHDAQYDAISDVYMVSADFHGDKEDPVTSQVPTSKEAVERLAEVSEVSLERLGVSEERLARHENVTVGVRVLSQCKGEYNELISRISSFLSLGLMRISGFDTGWRTFSLVHDS